MKEQVGALAGLLAALVLLVSWGGGGGGGGGGRYELQSLSSGGAGHELLSGVRSLAKLLRDKEGRRRAGERISSLNDVRRMEKDALVLLQLLDGNLSSTAVDCDRKEDYENSISSLNQLLDQIAKDNATRSLQDQQRALIRDKAIQNWQDVKDAYDNATSLLEKTNAMLTRAKNNFVTFQQEMEDLDLEIQDIQKQKITAQAGASKTTSDVEDVRRYVELLRSAIQTGNQDEYDTRMEEVLSIINRMSIDDAKRKILSDSISAPAGPNEAASLLLDTIADQARNSSAVISQRLNTLQNARSELEALYRKAQLDFVTLSEDLDRQTEIKRKALSELYTLEGRKLAAELSYSAWSQELSMAEKSSADVTKAANSLKTKIQKSLAYCSSSNKVERPKNPSLRATVKIHS
eukprot:761518-Hanusia_phi.AAC.9